MAEVQQFVDKVKKELGFVMEFAPKVERSVYGMSTSKGFQGGVGIKATAQEILAKYDEMNGYITKNGYKVKNRTFFNLETKAPVLDPKITLIIRVNGVFMEYEEGAPMSLEMQLATKQAEEEKAAKEDVEEEPKKNGKGKGKKKRGEEESESN